MDLRESHQLAVNRHPWELARIRALRKIALPCWRLAPGLNVLDLGCGDGFLIDALCPASTDTIDAVDIHLTDEQLSSFAKERPRLRFHNAYHSLSANAYGLVTMFDVLEHIEDDTLFLQETIARFASPGAIFFCTVPAFQRLFSSHDTFLQHHRRYSLAELTALLNRAGLKVISSGYLFALLLPVRAAAVLAEKLFGATDRAPGIGHWPHGTLLTSILTAILAADNLMMQILGTIGIKLPGLTAWAICQTPR